MSCPKDQVFNHATYKCECRAGYKLTKDNKCVPENTCPPNSSYESWQKKCVCWNGFKEENYKCVPVCPAGYELDFKHQKQCIKSCHEWNTYYDFEKDDCVSCPPNSLWEPSWYECRCYGGFEKVYDQCLPACPNGTIRKGYDCKPW